MSSVLFCSLVFTPYFLTPTAGAYIYLMYVLVNTHTQTQRLVRVCLSCPFYVLLFIQTGSALAMASFLMTDLWLFARKLAGGLLWPYVRLCVHVCVCKKERNMFSKRTHSHPKNTGVDSEKYSSRVLICLFCTSAYLLSHRFVITDKHQMANVLFPSKKKNKLLIDRVANLIWAEMGIVYCSV